MKSLAQFRSIQSAIDPKTGRYDAKQVAALLDWTSAEVAQYLERSPAMIAGSPTSPTLQDRLAVLAALFRDLVELFTIPDEKDIDPDIRAYRLGSERLEPTAAARAWLRTPIRSLDNASAKARILEGRIDWVQGVVEAMHEGPTF